MAVINSVPGSGTLKYDDVIGVTLNKGTLRKLLSGSTLGSALNAQSRGKMTKRRNNSRNHGKSRGKLKGNKSQSKGPRDC